APRRSSSSPSAVSLARTTPLAGAPEVRLRILRGRRKGRWRGTSENGVGGTVESEPRHSHELLSLLRSFSGGVPHAQNHHFVCGNRVENQERISTNREHADARLVLGSTHSGEAPKPSRQLLNARNEFRRGHAIVL